MSDDASARLGLPYLAAGQLQKHVTLNEALTRLDALTQTAVVSRTVTAQPAAPADGALYILPAGATGADWSGRPAGSLMRAEAGAGSRSRRRKVCWPSCWTAMRFWLAAPGPGRRSSPVLSSR